MRFLKMMMTPLIISSLITGTSSLDPKSNAKIALRTIILFFATNIISILYGLSLAMLFRPGDGNVGNKFHSDKTIRRSAGIRDNLLDLGRYYKTWRLKNI